MPEVLGSAAPGSALTLVLAKGSGSGGEGQGSSSPLDITIGPKSVLSGGSTLLLELAEDAACFLGRLCYVCVCVCVRAW